MKIIEAIFRIKATGEEFPVLYSFDPSEAPAGEEIKAVKEAAYLGEKDEQEILSAEDVTEEVHAHAREAMAILHKWANGNKRKEFIEDVIGEQVIQD